MLQNWRTSLCLIRSASRLPYVRQRSNGCGRFRSHNLRFQASAVLTKVKKHMNIKQGTQIRTARRGRQVLNLRGAVVLFNRLGCAE